jgi:isoleucyl-tRNA synthetase
LKRYGLISKRYKVFSKSKLISWGRKFWIVIAGNWITLTIEDVEITSQDIEGWLVANQTEHGCTWYYNHQN